MIDIGEHSNFRPSININSDFLSLIVRLNDLLAASIIEKTKKEEESLHLQRIRLDVIILVQYI